MSRSLNDARYRPAVLVIAGITAAYTIYLIRQRYLTARPDSDRQTPPRRRNAIRRHDAPRRRQTRSPPRQVDSIALSEEAIAALNARELSGRPYTFPARSEPGTQWPVLPSTIPTTQQFQEEIDGISTEEAQSTRLHAERMFMNVFLAYQYPLNHTIGPREASYLDEQLQRMGIDSRVIHQSILRFNSDPVFGAEMQQTFQHGDQHPPFADAAGRGWDGGETAADDQSNFDWREGNTDDDADREGQDTLNLLYNIAADEARKDGYIHRGVECDACKTMPIQGIRYRCANCVDFDLCESCEAQEVHIKTHVFYKIRVPVPSLGALGNSRQDIPVWYPGKPAAMSRSLPRELATRLLQESGVENSELDALWDQFRCLAGTEWNQDPNHLDMAIDRKTFDRCFVPALSIRPPPPNLIYDRIFAFYDTNHDGLIGFEEFLKGLARLSDRSREGKLSRIFRGYDIDNDGYVDRKDFLRIFRAFYTLHKEMDREIVAGMEEDIIEPGARDIVHGSQPISSAFPGSILGGHVSHDGLGKTLDAHGDLTITDHHGVLDEGCHDVGDRNQFIAAMAMRSQQDPVDGSRVLSGQAGSTEAEYQADSARRRNDALQERWQRRRFYTDVEEGGTAPPGYTEADSSEDEADAEHGIGSTTSASISRPLSPRSRSSSKVRFEDSVTDTDHESRSNTSSRSIPVGERWGGYDLSEAEKDAGKEILYQAVQQGFNELLDQLFKDKEDLAMEAHASRKMRRQHADAIQAFAHPAAGASAAHDPEAKTTNPHGTLPVAPAPDMELDRLILEAGYGVEAWPGEQQSSAGSRTMPVPPPLPADHPLNIGEATVFNMADVLPFKACLEPNTMTMTTAIENTLPGRDPTLPQFLPNEPGTNAPTPSPTPISIPTPIAIAIAIPLPLHPLPPSETAPPPDLPTLHQHQHLPLPLHPPFSAAQKKLLAILVKHEAVDKEAKVRGGFGKLDYAEFMRGMVGDEGDGKGEGEGWGDGGGVVGGGGGRGGGVGVGIGEGGLGGHIGEGGEGREGGGVGGVGGGEGGGETGVAAAAAAAGTQDGVYRGAKDGMGRLGFVGSWIEIGIF